MSDVFIAYGRSDLDRIRPVIVELSKLGFACWWDQQLVAGANWSRTIDQAIRSARAVVVFWSSSSVDSAWVRSEAQFALQDDKFFPVLIDPSAKVPLGFGTFQYITGATAGEIAQKLAISLAARGIHPTAPPSAAQTKVREASQARNKGYAFISYVDEDRPHRNDTASFLESRRFGYWEYDEGERDYQKSTYDEIEDRISNSELVLSLVTPEWKKSEWAYQEYQFARDVGKKVFLLRFVDPGPSLVLAGKTFIDCERNPKKGFERLAKELDRVGL